MIKNKKGIVLLFMLSLICLFTGCTKTESIKVKLGYKNQDFDFIKQNDVPKITIQSNRDNGFKFIVTDKRTVNDIYNILSSGKAVEGKTNLDADYTFEIYENEDKIHKFSYVAGIQEKGMGNFYDESKNYVVSKRIDNDIIKNMATLRKPRNFETLYYDSILAFIDQNIKNTMKDEKKIGVNISNDVEVAKYMLSIDIEDFKINLKNKMSNLSLVEDNKEDFDILINVKTYGYKTTVYKSVITLYNKTDNSETDYYVWCKNEDKDWKINITEKKPLDF
ncbi:hypothetical protein [Clostridium algidicarnis]|uniref:YhfM-like domain-containing protein n=3 Tax=Clostridium algidicarnis TaxID=37659 RepID=A0A2S6FZ27_9CLOT|nr:hypothetical protein [Clostridium algidicarnis]MBB6696896.1 hypothetical protein [Clostridium algidicarnis]MBU3193245.1 hypothetical protein [Clostridium algidicarnis]MBU3196926.1 hypothetical protein [Clostridium algidicarnis]MBU3204601.1 hypothetical protein [Clostridium algidicarnis]MBU3206555.1 hypothetical protein [Clostridium algidicarnis]